ncbi:MAG: integration host factor subunit beta [Flavobacteriales bacterium]|jgi:DNA-binding protein HU-beta|nr:integration host factor subunit beta [Flavobacteriales bacterium]|tara:strand:- start:1992 stop:2291 length:300 start_codon:yes stop_codon:yes gene_type:complete
MIKAELVNKLSVKTGVERKVISAVIETFMETVKISLEKGENVYLREFGTFAIKEKAEKKARNIVKTSDGYVTTTITVPAHTVPSFKPAKKFIERVKKNN